MTLYTSPMNIAIAIRAGLFTCLLYSQLGPKGITQEQKSTPFSFVLFIVIFLDLFICHSFTLLPINKNMPPFFLLEGCFHSLRFREEENTYLMISSQAEG